MKNPFTSKTIIMGVVVGILAIANYFQGVVTDPHVLSIIGSVVAVLQIINRFFTNEPVAPLTNPTKGDTE